MVVSVRSKVDNYGLIQALGHRKISINRAMGFVFHEAPGLADLVRIQTSKTLCMIVTCVSDVDSLLWTEGICYLYFDFRSPGSSCRNPYSSLLR